MPREGGVHIVHVGIVEARADDRGLQEGWKAARFMERYDGARRLGNYLHHYNRALVEQDRKTVRAYLNGEREPGARQRAVDP